MQDNQIITAQDLNNIAVDLGAVTFSNFEDGKAYAVPELNNITKELVTKGILKTQNECKCTINDNAVTVDTGVVVFSDGCKIRIEEPQTIQLSSEELTYIFVEHDNELDRVTLTSDTQLPTNDYVLLATAENGTITDKRSYSIAKVNLTAEGKSYMVTLEVPGYSSSYSPVIRSVTVTITDTSKVFCSVIADQKNNHNYYLYTGEVTAMYNMTGDKTIQYHSAYYKSSDLLSNEHGGTQSSYNSEQAITIDGNNLTYTLTNNTTVNYTINIYVFDGLVS